MANAFLTPSVIARAIIAVLRREVVLPNLVFRDAEAEFAGKIGDTVTVRMGAFVAAKTRTLGVTTPVVLGDAVEFGVDVTLATDVYSAIAVTDAELTLDVEDFVRQVVAPQLAGVIEVLEDNVATTLTGAPYEDESEWDTSDPFGNLIVLNKRLNQNNVPRAGRRLVVGSEIEANLLSDDRITSAQVAGPDALPALRDAQIARRLGFDIYGSNAVGDEDAYAFHRTAVAMANRAPQVPASIENGSSQELETLAVRVITDYDSSSLTDRSVLNSYVGSSIVQEPDDPTDPNEADFTLKRAVKASLAGSS